MGELSPDPLEGLERSLATWPASRSRLPGLRRAAVLVPVFRGPQGLHAVFTRRLDTLSHHPGQVSFPGGRLDPGESPWQAALREAEEEIALPRERVRALGTLSEVLVGVSGHVMTPFVAEIPADVELHPSPHEVARVFDVPLRELTDPKRTRFTRRPRLFRGKSYSIPYFEWEDELIWGATGKVLVELLDVLGRKTELLDAGS